ncbi:MAG: D-aminoacyl-tRNA deacylase [Thermodesulfobacteriota bacterium]
MKAVVQRVKSAKVTVGDEVTGEIGPGLLVLLGVARNDAEEQCRYLCDKIANLRIFEDAEGKMNRSLLDLGLQMLVVSQFTLYADCRKGRRPSFVDAAPPETAEPLYLKFVEMARGLGVSAATGRFGAMMDVALVNGGPVTIIVESA